MILKKPLRFDKTKDYFEIVKIRNESSKTLASNEVRVEAGFLVSGRGYNFSLEVRDTSGEMTVVHSQLQPTPPLNAFVG